MTVLNTIDEVSDAINGFGLGYLVEQGYLEDCEDYRIVAAAQRAREAMADIRGYVEEGL